MTNCILYNNKKENGKIYKLYYKEEEKLVTIDDGCYKYELEYLEEEPVKNLINKFEDYIESLQECSEIEDKLIDFGQLEGD